MNLKSVMCRKWKYKQKGYSGKKWGLNRCLNMFKNFNGVDLELGSNKIKGGGQ